jgi:arginine decarboxylase
MLDPIKSTIVTPGLDLNGKFAKTGIPASVVTKFLAEHGVIVEKTGLYSFFIMFTIGITKGRWNTLLSALQQFKDDYAQEPADVAHPAGVLPAAPALRAHGPARPVPAHPRAVCQVRHRAPDDRDVPERPAPAMKPSDAFAHIAHRKTERVEIDDLEGRITTSLITPYPPGIPLLIPGEVFNKKIVDYLKFSREFNLQCPGFETDIHGLVARVDETGKKRYYADCVVALAAVERAAAVQHQAFAAHLHRLVEQGLQGRAWWRAPAARATTHGASVIGSSLRSAARRVVKSPGWARACRTP